MDVVQEELPGVDATDAHFVVGPADVDPVPGPLHDERRDGVVCPAGRVARLGEHGVPVGFAHTGHPALGAVEHPTALGSVVGHAASPHAHHVTARLGLGQSEGSALGPVTDARQVPALLRLRAGDHDRPCREAGQQEHQRRRVGVLRHLLDRQGQAEDARARAAVLVRDAEPEKARVAKGLEDVARVAAVFVDGPGARFDLVLSEAPNGISELGELVGEFKMHR